MLFRKLFQLLVVGGTVMGATSGCSTAPRGQQTTDSKADGGAVSGDGKAQAQPSGGTAASDAGGGVTGW
jgi:hypothetical protein